MNIGLIPLDERPVNTSYPAMIAAIAGAALALPPPEILSSMRRPADCAALVQWLAGTAPQLDGLIVSCEMLGYGSLIASRISDEPAGAILARLDSLRAIRRAQPQLPIYGFSLITRVANANDATEESEYRAIYGEQLYRASQLLDQHQQGRPVASELDALLAEIPPAVRHDFLRRRLRNHTVNAAVLHMLADGVFDLLVLSSDDTSPFGLPSREKRWLESWADLLGLNPHSAGSQQPLATRPELSPADDRLLMYPGADEVGCVLLARLINRHAGATPSFAVAYAPPASAELVAAYEDGPIRVTVERQIRAAGGTLVENHADIWIGVNAPVARRSEWQPAFAEAERAERLPALQALVAEINMRRARGQPVLIADLAYPNGADPALIELLQDQDDLTTLAAYGAWNTAGNTIGTALAQSCAAQFARSDAQRAAQRRFLLHRFIEDWGYQQIVRADLRAWLQRFYGAPEPSAATLAAACARAEQQLGALIAQLPGFAGNYRIAPGSLRLPWRRTFEVDFELAAI